MKPLSIAIAGLGKIARDQHVPVIAADRRFKLAGIVSTSGQTVEGVPTFGSLAALFAALPGLDAVALCTPPSVRHDWARQTIAAGKHVLLEKPPAGTLGEAEDLIGAASAKGVSLFATWHSRFNAGVQEVKRRLEGRRIRALRIDWKEDVRRWHPGQDWVFARGGFGVFDPGINALSILTHIMPGPVFVAAADLTTPVNRQSPIAATLTLASPAATPDGTLTAEFDWRQQGGEIWTIAIETEGGERLTLTHGGAKLLIDDKPTLEEAPAEYAGIYRRFAALIDARASDADLSPLRIVADAALVGRHHAADAFDW